MAIQDNRGDGTGDAKDIVRSFSWEAFADDPDDGLTKSLVKAEIDGKLEEVQEPLLKDQWMQLFDPAIGEAFKYGTPFTLALVCGLMM